MQFGWQHLIKAAILLAVFTVGFFIGGSRIHSSLYKSETADAFIYNGPWFTSRYAGASDADARTRALVAVTGLLALSREETVYFRLHEDNEGRPLSSDYDYVLKGADLPARWWSITLYDSDHYLNQEANGPYSVKSTTLEREEDGSIRISLSSDPKEGNWIDMGTGQKMSLSMRVYNPSPELVDNLETAPLFTIERIEKGQGS